MDKYKFNFSVTAKIDAATVKDMIKSVVENQTGRKVKAVELDVGTRTQGWGSTEYEVAIFNGVTVHFEKDSIV